MTINGHTNDKYLTSAEIGFRTIIEAHNDLIDYIIYLRDRVEALESEIEKERSFSISEKLGIKKI